MAQLTARSLPIPDDPGMAHFIKKSNKLGAAVAQWICMRLPSCHPGSNPKHTIYPFINLNLSLNCDMLKRQKINRKRDRDWPFLNKNLFSPSTTGFQFYFYFICIPTRVFLKKD